MTNEEAKQIFLDRGFVNGIFDGDKWRESVIVISKWLKQTDGDLISRKETIEWLKKVTVTDGITFETGFKQILVDIEQMPSAEKTAEWRIVGNTTMHYECSLCGGAVDKWDNFCKHCGARMKGVD